MSLGPFATYAPPGVYTRTLTEAPNAATLAGLRIPVLIGVGQEELEQDDFELVRGSSSSVDQQIVNESASGRWVVDETNPNVPVLGNQSGLLLKFMVRNSPLVDGQGIGRVTNDTRSVTVTVNGIQVAVGQVIGASGYVILQVPTQPTDDVRVTYYFHRMDTAFTDDVSAQVTADAASLISPGFELFNVQLGVSDTFSFYVNGAGYVVVFAAGTPTASSLKTQIDAIGIPGLTTAVFTDNEGRNHLKLSSAVSLVIGSGNANGILGWAQGTATTRTVDFQVFQRPIVDGTGGGITTTDPTKVVVTVNGTVVAASAVDGKNGIVTLPSAPISGSVVTIAYWANTWQDTFDYLPNSGVTSAVRCGISPGRSDYIEGQDFVLANPSSDTSVIRWGASWAIAAVRHTAGSTTFDDTQILPSLQDDRIFLAACQRYVDTSVVPAVSSNTKFLLPAIPTMGNGRDTPLGQTLYASVANNRIDQATDRPDLIIARVGRTLRDALNRAAVKVVAVDGPTRKITLQSPIPADWNVYATFWYSRLADDTYMFTCKVPGAVGAGKYEIFSSLINRNLYQVKFGTKSGSLTDTVQWPRGVEQVPDAFNYGGAPVSEIVTVTFGTTLAGNAVWTVRNPAPWSFFDSHSDQWTTKVNGVNQQVDLGTAYVGFLVGGHVALDGAGKITIPAGPGNVLNLTIEGTPVTCPITAGARTPVQIVADINGAIDGTAPFDGTAPNALASFVQIGSNPDVLFYIKSLTVPAALPGGFDHNSYVAIRLGTIEGTLGFSAYQSAYGTPTATCKNATILGSVAAATFAIVTGTNDIFQFQHNGITYTVTLTAGVARTVAQIVADINNPAVGGLSGTASVGTLANLNKVRLKSLTNDESSSLVILSGTANATLGFTTNANASATRVNVQEVVDAMNGTSGFLAGAICYPNTINGQIYLTLESLTTGLTGSSLSFVDVTNSAFNPTTGTGTITGTSGDGDVGENAYDKFTVTSNNPSGSAGTGYPGQTYTDARTGLRFTILPASDGSYVGGGYFTLLVSTTFDVAPSIPLYSVPGVELIVTDTVGVAANDVSNLQTFSPSGLEPSIGDSYYLSYRYVKADWSTLLFRQQNLVEANYGSKSSENRVSLAAYLQFLNGAPVVGIKQVKKQPGTSQASDADFISAIAGLLTPLPGNVRPDLLIPLSTSTSVYAYLTNHVEVASNIRNQSERMGYIGFASGTVPTAAQGIARSLKSNRVVSFYPDSSVITLTDELNQSYETLVDGTFFAAAVGGSSCSPAYDVATPYTRRKILGFTRIPRALDLIDSNTTAIAGITLLEDLGTYIRIRQGLTTNMDNVLVRLPTVTQIADYVQQQSRSTLDPYIGAKFISSKAGEISDSMGSLFKSLVQAEIVAAYLPFSTAPDSEDPTTMRVESAYQPIFPLLYIVLTFSLRTKLG